MAWASTVAVVVPSPATSDVLLATSLTICAPMFSSAFFRSICFATVTPSFVIVGDPYALPMMTLRPLGPSVTFTAFASELTPRRIAWRDASPYVMSLAIVCSFWLRMWSAFLVGNSGHARIDRQPVVLLHDQIVHAVAGPVRSCMWTLRRRWLRLPTPRGMSAACVRTRGIIGAARPGPRRSILMPAL